MISNLFDIETPINVGGYDEIENQKKLQESVRNFNEHFPQNSGIDSLIHSTNGETNGETTEETKENAFEHIMNSAMFQLSQTENDMLLKGHNLVSSQIPVNVLNSQVVGSQMVGSQVMNPHVMNPQVMQVGDGVMIPQDINTQDMNNQTIDREQQLFEESERQIEEERNNPQQNQTSTFPFLSSVKKI
jgi:hypothetical protein